MPDLSAPRQWHASSQNPFHRRERERFRETEQPLLPTSRSRSKAGWDASLLFLTLALVTSGSMGWLALKIFCASCWGLRQERGESGPRPAALGCPPWTSCGSAPSSCSQAQLLPALEEVLGCHLRRLEELVDGYRELQGEGLGGTSISGQERGGLHQITPLTQKSRPPGRPY